MWSPERQEGRQLWNSSCNRATKTAERCSLGTSRVRAGFICIPLSFFTRRFLHSKRGTCCEINIQNADQQRRRHQKFSSQVTSARTFSPRCRSQCFSCATEDDTRTPSEPGESCRRGNGKSRRVSFMLNLLRMYKPEKTSPTQNPPGASFLDQWFSKKELKIAINTHSRCYDLISPLGGTSVYNQKCNNLYYYSVLKPPTATKALEYIKSNLS